MAKVLGADFQLTVKQGDGPQQLAKRVEGLLGTQPHITIECTGVESSVQTAIYVRVLVRTPLRFMQWAQRMIRCSSSQKFTTLKHSNVFLKYV